MSELTTTDNTADELILVRSDLGDGGWSLHAPGTTDEAIAESGAGLLLSGEASKDADGEWDRPNAEDYAAAQRASRDLPVGLARAR